LPLNLQWVEGQVVVAASSDEAVRSGDIIERIDGTAAQEAVIEAERYISGSPQWKRWRAMRAIGAGEEGSTAELVTRRGDQTIELEILRQPVRQQTAAPAEPRPERIEKLEPGIYYVDLSRAEISEIDDRMAEISAASGVIFDLRGYPNGTHGVISHLLEAPDTADDWMRVAQIIYPDHVEPSGYREIGWNIQPLEPHIDARVAFMADGRAISYAESVMGFIEGYRLAEIVGQPTAGANGNVVAIELPGGFRVMWTGMKVVKHDGSQQHLVGILPTVPAERTIEGVREGRDEVLEKALEVVKRVPRELQS
jgi:C-terminal processing protease CtpA/Prc